MKKLQTLLIIITAALFFTACQKEESVEIYDSISGVLTAGENVTADDLSGIKLYLGKLQEGIDPASFTLKTGKVETATTQTINTDGIFTFNNLANGNYVLLVEPGYTFLEHEYLIASIDGVSEPKPIQQSVYRTEPDNTPISADPFIIQQVTYAYMGFMDPYFVQEIEIQCVVNNQANLSDLSLNLSTYTSDIEKTTTTFPINKEGQTTIVLNVFDVLAHIHFSHLYQDESQNFMDEYLYYFGANQNVNDFEIEEKVKIGSLSNKNIKIVFHKIEDRNYSIILSDE